VVAMPSQKLPLSKQAEAEEVLTAVDLRGAHSVVEHQWRWHRTNHANSTSSRAHTAGVQTGAARAGEPSCGCALVQTYGDMAEDNRI
jgi:hypothetical protein